MPGQARHDKLRDREGITHSTLYIPHCVSRVFKGRALRRGGGEQRSANQGETSPFFIKCKKRRNMAQT